ncbi:MULTISPECIES: sensor histidine kinase [Romboutsia]|uniref:Two-component sensor histidine kinase n=1 Tax=Romboutsia hominis TaxID=1507512 RepID=A0A2P2BUJ5_9FIRM|nr:MULTISPECIES: GHKL domain-containing protein [Romboutsia]MCH1960005.1 GHKL domain-containing protein [Romboutsia hominis]MCH1969567.1 GHKL domain-containing protein [Romboutsia hominis]MDB8791277.1 GHKL domain-containing protein [Romboutsia sp. 1001216sp1]MDB8794540.1 GHKL domain-containing protein [Romboutsia sp. 1001216sp1]MDB8796110.1 GHKL domain-containing protein [Romboutsia sp. 1001216sp1]
MNNIYILPVYILLLFIGTSLLFNRYEFYRKLSLNKKSLLSFFVSFITFLLFNILYKHILFEVINDYFLRGIIKTSLSFVLIIICIYIGNKFIKLVDDNIIKEKNLNASNNKIEHKDNIIAKLRSQKHDYLKHLQVVYSLLNTGLTNDAKEYITNISNNFRSKTSRYGKVSYLDAIASLKYEECLMKNITFDVYIQDFIDNLIIEPNEMSSVLLNIIDNAIDSLSTISKDNKYIKLFVYEDEFQYVISIKNNGPKIYNTDAIFLEGYSTKDGTDRGYGLYLVKNILDKYGYYIFANSDDFLTEFTILIPKYN